MEVALLGATVLQRSVSQEEAAAHHVSGLMMRLASSAEILGKIARLLEDATIRTDVATVYALEDVAHKASG